MLRCGQRAVLRIVINTQRAYSIYKYTVVTMADGRFIAYYRVSTAKQGRSGLGLDAQRQMVAEYLNGGDWSLLGGFTEIESGRRSDRPELAKALAACRKYKATLVIAKLDRLARSVAFIANLMEAKVDFIACDMPAANRFTLHVMAAMAEHEAHLIAERTRAALQAAKGRGAALGWAMPARREQQPQAAARGAASNRAAAVRHAANVGPIIGSLRAAGVTTLSGIADALNARGIATARGGMWHPTTVRNLLAKIGE